MNWVYIRSEPHLFTVGFYDPKGIWNSDSDHEDKEDAAKRVAFLNGEHACRTCGLKRSLDYALNTGDGVYRP
jgi:hypothetical protein